MPPLLILVFGSLCGLSTVFFQKKALSSLSLVNRDASTRSQYTRAVRQHLVSRFPLRGFRLGGCAGIIELCCLIGQTISVYGWKGTERSDVVVVGLSGHRRHSTFEGKKAATLAGNHDEDITFAGHSNAEGARAAFDGKTIANELEGC